MTQPLALIVEDDAKLADIFSEAVKASGFTATVAVNGRLAMERLDEIIPTLILLDLHLPDVSGDVVLGHVQQDERLADCIIILTTADAWMAETLRSQVDFVLMKPISFIQLRDLTGRLRPSSPDTV
ncbi:MAG: response regulator [Ardenticatenaceae bacterium]|nr:response regulator [Ardenticatenaceae bacterium]MCB8947291.1 response regulator [Ardenticatenaceae bacterium]